MFKIYLSLGILEQQVFKFPYFFVKFGEEAAVQRGRDSICHQYACLMFNPVNLKIFGVFLPLPTVFALINAPKKAPLVSVR